jgi:transcriptional regulator with XRE-family HTH domain
MHPFNRISTEKLQEIAKRAGTTLGYLQQIKYGNRVPSRVLARKIEIAARDMGIEISRMELLYPPNENAD